MVGRSTKKKQRADQGWEWSLTGYSSYGVGSRLPVTVSVFSELVICQLTLVNKAVNWTPDPCSRCAQCGPPPRQCPTCASHIPTPMPMPHSHYSISTHDA